MSPRPSRSNLLDVLPGFAEEEQLTLIHVRPTLSMPPFPAHAEPANDHEPLAISSTVAALLAQSDAEEKIQDVTDFLEVAEDDTLSAPVSPPAPKAKSASPRVRARTPLKKAPASFARMAFTIAAVGFGIGFFFTSPPAQPVSAAAAPASAPSVVEPTVEPVVEAPVVSARPAAAPAEVASPAPASKKPATGLTDADRALRAGDLSLAATIYQSVLARGGSDHEALTGLGKVAAARHQSTDAMTFFERALALQPSYLPARLGIADALWDASRTDAAKAQYEEIRTRYSPTMVPARAIERTR